MFYVFGNKNGVFRFPFVDSNQGGMKITQSTTSDLKGSTGGCTSQSLFEKRNKIKLALSSLKGDFKPDRCPDCCW